MTTPAARDGTRDGVLLRRLATLLDTRVVLDYQGMAGLLREVADRVEGRARRAGPALQGALGYDIVRRDAPPAAPPATSSLLEVPPMLPLPMNQSQATATGDTATTPIPVSGLKSTDVLLAVVRWKPGEIASGLDPTAFTVADGTITHATEDLSDYALAVTWTRS